MSFDLTSPTDQDDDDAAFALFQAKLAELNHNEDEREDEVEARRQLWLAHHWPKDYAQRCLSVGGHHVCRRCAALYPLGILVGFLAALGYPIWSSDLDPMLIWVLCIPASAAFVGEAVGLFDYSPRWQVATTLLAALAFGRALGYELVDRWSPEFWQPIAIFGGLWFLASVFQHTMNQGRSTEYRA